MIIPRPWIQVPDGRVFYGIWPQNLSAKRETPYIRALAVAVKGVCEVTLPAGRADVATNAVAFEVEPVARWKAGARQAFAYGAMAGLQPAVGLFGTADYEKIYLRVRDKMQPLALWVYAYGRWNLVTSRKAALSASAKGAHGPQWVDGMGGPN